MMEAEQDERRDLRDLRDLHACPYPPEFRALLLLSIAPEIEWVKL